MVVVVIPEKTLDLKVNSALDKFNQSAVNYFMDQGISSNGPASKILILFFMTIVCGILGSLFTFPGLRVGRMHIDALKCYQEKRIVKLLLNINFSFPFILILLWINPISRETQKYLNGMSNTLYVKKLM